MSRELYRARSKKVQKLGRDGLVEQDRATGQERRVSQKAADVSFGPEHPEPERAAPARTRQQSRQRREYQREIRQSEERTGNPAFYTNRETSPETVEPDMPAPDDVFSDAFQSDGYLSDTAGPEIVNPALSMREAVDMPMMAAPATTEAGPVLVRLRTRGAGKEIAKDSGKESKTGGVSNAGKDFSKDGISPRQNGRQSERQDGGTRLKFDGERRITPEKHPAQSEGDAQSPSMRRAEDRPLIDRSSVRDAPRHAKYHSDTGGRLRFDADRGSEDNPDNRTGRKKQAAYQFSSDGAESRLRFENAKPLSNGGAGTDETRLRFTPDTPVIPDLAMPVFSEDTDEEQVETDAVEAAMEIAIPAAHALRPPPKPKRERASRRKSGKDPEENRNAEKRDNADDTAESPQTNLQNPDTEENRNEPRIFEDVTPDHIENETAEPPSEPVRKAVPLEKNGRLRFERNHETDGVNSEQSRPPALKLENRERLQFDRERNHTPLPEKRNGKSAGKLTIEKDTKETRDAGKRDEPRIFEDVTPDNAGYEKAEPPSEPVRKAVPVERNGRLRFERNHERGEADPEAYQCQTAKPESRERLRFEDERKTVAPNNPRNWTGPERNKVVLRLPTHVDDTSEPRLRFETDSPWNTSLETDSASWTPETSVEPLYAVIDGQEIPVEVLDPAPTPDGNFHQRDGVFRRSRTDQRKPVQRKSGGIQASRASSATPLDSAETEGSRLRFESDTQTEPPLYEGKVIDDFSGADPYQSPDRTVHIDAIDVDFRPVDPPPEPAKPDGRADGKKKRYSRNDVETSPPIERMEDGARVRFDAEWNADSSGQDKKKKSATTEKKRPFLWKRNAAKPPTKSPDSAPPAAEPKTKSEQNNAEKNTAASRLRFEEKPTKLTEESRHPRKGPRLMFGIGKFVKPVDSNKSTVKEAPPAADFKSAQEKQRGLSWRIGQRRKIRESNQTGTPEAVRSQAADEKPIQDPDTPELFTRTRRKQSEKDSIESEKESNAAEKARDRKSENADAKKKRQRLQFEKEPRPTGDPEAEGYTRKPPRQDAEDLEREPDAEPHKPRLRFENDAPRDNDAPSGGQTEPTGNPGDASNIVPQKPLTREEKQAVKAEQRVQKASRRLERAQSKIPVKRRVKLEKQYDESAGKVKHRLRFEKESVPEGGFPSPLPMRLMGGAADSARVTLLLKGHQEIREAERQNVGLEAAHTGELVAEQGVGSFLRWNHRRLRTKPYRAVRQAERVLAREQVNLEWRRMVRDHPELQRKHALTKWIQKQRLKRKYAAAAREAKKTEQHTQYVLNETGQIIRAAAKYIAVKKSVLATVALLGLIVLLFSTGLTSCMAMLSSFQSSYISVSYMANEDDITAADLYYSEMETDLQIDIDETEITHPGYDEYRYHVGEIAHNPFELLSYLSTKYNAFKFRRIKPDIEALFWQQYTLTRTVVVETRYDSEGDPYDWYVLVTTLTVRPLASVISEKLDAGEETTRYGLYMQTFGSRQAYGNPFDFVWLGRVSSLYGYRKHPMTGAKNLHRGVDIGAPAGTEIHAIQDGRAVSAGENGNYGLCVIVEDDKGYSSLYAHCSRLDVRAGQRVKRGDVIAAVGSAGSSTGPHLHLETKLDGEYLNPLFFVETGGGGAAPGGGEGGVVYPGYPGEPPTDETYARMLEEAEKYLGYPYVWGGSSPATSFDCSGFVSWVINHSGWNVGRLGAQALCNLCTPVSPEDARPGDLVFFRYTYNAPIPDGVTHCGIYVGNQSMIHCGDPISYASLNNSYWQAHFYCFGRLPNP